MVAAFDDNPVGIDIEAINNRIDLEIAKRFFSVSEAEMLNSQKAEGVGLSLPLNSFAFEISAEQEDIRFYPGYESDVNWYFKQYSIDPGYALAGLWKEA
jgi:phosphopantetheinyl transferase